MTKKDIQKLLDVVKENHQWHKDNDPWDGYQESHIETGNVKAIAILQAALAEPSEPVAEVAGDYNTKHIIFLPAGIALEVGDKLFTHPAKPEPSEPDCSPNHLCNGRMVHLPNGEQCDKCGETP